MSIRFDIDNFVFLLLSTLREAKKKSSHLLLWWVSFSQEYSQRQILWYRMLTRKENHTQTNKQWIRLDLWFDLFFCEFVRFWTNSSFDGLSLKSVSTQSFTKVLKACASASFLEKPTCSSLTFMLSSNFTCEHANISKFLHLRIYVRIFTGKHTQVLMFHWHAP